jgi:hypothetical protein
MTNVHVERKGDKLVLTIDISDAMRAKAEPSKSGKTKVLASTHGFTPVEGVGISLNLNATVK